MTLHIMGGGASKGIVEVLQAQFEARHPGAFHKTFSAVGAMRDAFVAGAPCDILILTRALMQDLTEKGLLVAGTSVDLGAVPTGIAVRTGTPRPAIATAGELRETLLAASDFYVPDLTLSTAGQHIANMLQGLGIAEQMQTRVRAFPNGETAMGHLAKTTTAQQVGCTQLTEIRMTPGLTWVGSLPSDYALSTVYTAAISTKAAEPALARVFLAALTSADSKKQREACGFVV